MEEKTGLDYAKLWKTLMRTGLKQRFSQVRSEFFMKLARDGVRKFKGIDDIEHIIDKTIVDRLNDGQLSDSPLTLKDLRS